MLKLHAFLSCAALAAAVAVPLHSQDIDLGRISGNFQVDAQYYTRDSAIGAEEVSEKVRSNAFLNLYYTRGNFSAGVRYEAYQKPLLGFDSRYEGNGIAFRYASYTSDDLEVTAGNFYEQFGNGLILRSYEEKQLGIDNAFDGVRVRARLYDGIRVTGLLGKQRLFWTTGPGIVRAADVDLSLNELLPSLQEDGWRLGLGGSVVSRFQEDRDPLYNLPENVAAFAGRLNAGYGEFSLIGEYAYKVNDPSTSNRFSYNPGTALFVSASYATTGLGVTLSGKRIDNMDFRSDRSATGNNLTLNYLPAITRQHTYTLPAIYPYGTQPTGEVGWQADVVYNIPRNSALGGKYGLDIAVNYSEVHQIDTAITDEFTYESPFPGVGDRLYFRDFNIELSKKWSTDLKTTLAYINLTYDKDQIEGKTGYGLVYSNIVVADITYRLTASNSVHVELQHMSSSQDETAQEKSYGDWVFGLVEYAVAPSWFFSLYDQYNYGNDDPDKRLHYYSAGVVFVQGVHRMSLSVGRQRGGLLCVGGVCRVVPAASGVTFSLSSSF